MENYIVKLGGTYDDVDVKCPKCKSKSITVSLDEGNYFAVIECEQCGYKKRKSD